MYADHVRVYHQLGGICEIGLDISKSCVFFEGRLKNMSNLLSVFGIVVSVLIGLTTFYIADRRSRRNRWQQARETILKELSKTLGEENIPNFEIISATIRSVLRGYNPGSLDKVTVVEVTDDLLRQITSDPFLDSERRNKLQTQVLDVKTAGLQAEEAMSEEEAIVSVAGSKVEAIDKFSILSLIAGIITSIIAAIGVVSLGWLIDLYKSAVDIINWSLPIIAAILTVIVSLILTWFMGTKGSGKK